MKRQLDRFTSILDKNSFVGSDFIYHRCRDVAEQQQMVDSGNWTPCMPDEFSVSFDYQIKNNSIPKLTEQTENSLDIITKALKDTKTVLSEAIFSALERMSLPLRSFTLINSTQFSFFNVRLRLQETGILDTVAVVDFHITFDLLSVCTILTKYFIFAYF